MNEAKREATVFNPKSTALRRKLWVRMQTPEGPRLFFLWSRIFKLLAVLLVLGWLGSATALWAFVKYQRGITAVQFIDIAFLPFRRAEYRASLAKFYHEAAQRQLAEQRWGEAVFSLRAAIARAPGNLAARGQLADMMLASRQPIPALRILEDGLPHAGDDQAYHLRVFTLLRAQQQQNRVLEIADRLLPAPPGTTPLHRLIAWQSARALHELKRHAEARERISRWQLEKAPEGRALLAEIAAALGQTDLALQLLRQELQRNPRNEAAAVQLTRLLLDLKQSDEARRVAMLRTLSHPASPGALLDLLSIEWQSGLMADYERTASDYLSRHATDARALNMLASFAAERALPQLAERTLVTARTHELPDDVFLFLQMQAQCSAGQYSAALATADELDQTATLSPPLSAALLLLKGWAHFGAGNVTEGETLIQRAIHLPQLPAVHALKTAVALEKLGAISAAERTFATAGARAPGEAAPLLAWANFLARHDKWTAAAELLPQLLALAEPPSSLVATIQTRQAEAETAAQALAAARATAAARAAAEVSAEAVARAAEAERVTATIRAQIAEEAARLHEADRAARAAATAKAEAETAAAAGGEKKP